MKYWLGLNGYCPAPVSLAQHLTYIGCRLVIVVLCLLGWTQLPTQLPTNIYYSILVRNTCQHSQQTRGVEPVLVRCWASVADGGPALGQRRVAGSVDKCFAPKWNNKFRLMHSLYCPQEPFNIINYKSHWHYIYQLSTFMVMLLEGRHLQFFVHKKLDISSSLLDRIMWIEIWTPSLSHEKWSPMCFKRERIYRPIHGFFLASVSIMPVRPNYLLVRPCRARVKSSINVNHLTAGAADIRVFIFY